MRLWWRSTGWKIISRYQDKDRSAACVTEGRAGQGRAEKRVGGDQGL